MKLNPIRLAVACCGVMSFTANATDYDSRPYLAPGFSYTIADSDRNSDDGFGAFFGVGKPLSLHWNLEVAARANKLDLSNGKSSFSQEGGMVDGLFFLNRDAMFAPYAVLGAGAMRSTLNGTSSKNAAVNAGIGFVHTMTKDGLGLRADVRYRMDMDDKNVAGQDSFGDVVVNVGLVMPLGERVKEKMTAAEPVAPVVEKVAPKQAAVVAPAPVVAAIAPKAEAAPAPVVAAVVVVDSDKDGVPDLADACANTPANSKVDAKGCEIDSDGDKIADSRDQCANTPAGAKVDAMGCEFDTDGDKIADSRDQCANTPAGAKVDAMGCEFDTDGDKIADSSDQCANTPAGVKVDAKGCALDGDADGIADASDACPNTKSGAKVDAKGCPVPQVLALNKVQFGLGKADLTPETKKALDAVVAEIKANPERVIEVDGHADALGSNEYNKKLSDSRAHAVSQYLIQKGVPATNVRVAAFGEEKPVASNDTDEGRAQNRRVEMFVTNE